VSIVASGALIGASPSYRGLCGSCDSRRAFRPAARAVPQPAPADTETDENAKPSTCVPHACTLVERDSRPDHRHGESHEERDEQLRGHCDAVLGRRSHRVRGCGSFEDGARRPLRSVPADDEEQREARSRKAHSMSRAARDPTSIEMVPSANTDDAGSLAVTSCDSTPAVKTMNRVAPASACEAWWKVAARISPEKPGEESVSCERRPGLQRLAGAGSLTENGARAAVGATPSPAPPRGRPARPYRARSRRWLGQDERPARPLREEALQQEDRCRARRR